MRERGNGWAAQSSGDGSMLCFRRQQVGDNGEGKSLNRSPTAVSLLEVGRIGTLAFALPFLFLRSATALYNR
jgi:hypothetical protein